MKEDKVIAKIVEKFYSGKAKTKNFLFLMNYLLDNSILGKSFDGEKAHIVVSLLDSKSGHQKLGTYKSENSAVYINEKYVELACKGEEGILAQIINTYGHEYTHHNQHLKGTLKEAKDGTIEDRLEEKDIAEMFKIATGRDPTDSEIIRIENMAQGSYLRQPHEEEARNNGGYFAIEALENLLKNQYLKEEVKNKIIKDLEDIKQEEIERKLDDEFFYSEYEKFIKFLRNKNIKDFMNDVVKNIGYGNNNFLLAIKVWIDAQEPELVIDSYSQLIGTGSEYKVLRKTLTEHIKSEAFPKELKDAFVDRLVSKFKNKDAPEQFYEEELKDILDDEQILEMYDSLLKGDLKKINCPLFDSEYKKEEYAVTKGKLIVKNLEYIKENFSKLDKEDLQVLKEEISDICDECRFQVEEDEDLKVLASLNERMHKKTMDTESVRR